MLILNIMLDIKVLDAIRHKHLNPRELCSVGCRELPLLSEIGETRNGANIADDAKSQCDFSHLRSSPLYSVLESYTLERSASCSSPYALEP